jgi:hypothetical protein
VIVFVIVGRSSGSICDVDGDIIVVLDILNVVVIFIVNSSSVSSGRVF